MSTEDNIVVDPVVATEVVEVSTPVEEASISVLSMTDEEAVAHYQKASVTPAVVVDTVEDNPTIIEDSDEVVAKVEEKDTTTVTNKEDSVESNKVEAKSEKDDKPPTESTDIDYKALYEQLTAPFKANGKEMSVKNVDEAITLMQMGANYNKNMAAMKPNRKFIKMLETADLLDESKLSYLIDLNRKDPNAINKLIKDSGIDVLNIDPEKGSEYQAKNYAASDKILELEAVLVDLESSPKYVELTEVVGNQWDVASKQTITEYPEILNVLENHMQTGIYDVVVQEVEREKMLGRLKGLSDIDAYRKVGDAIQERGGFDFLNAKEIKEPAKPVVVVPPPKIADNDKVNEKKRAASASKPSVTSAVTTPKALELSDEEFMKAFKR